MPGKPDRCVTRFKSAEGHTVSSESSLTSSVHLPEADTAVFRSEAGNGLKADINKTMQKSRWLVGGHSPMHSFRFALIEALQSQSIPPMRPRDQPPKKAALSAAR